MPTRIVREGILTSDRVNALSERAELFYRRLMSVVDDYGRFSANLTLLRASCYPLKLDSVKEDSIKKHLAEAEDAGLIVLYTVAGKAYLELQDFGQRVQSKSKYPEPHGALQGFTVDHRESPDKTALVGVGVGVDISNPTGLEVIASANDLPTADESTRATDEAKADRCPIQRIVELYHAKLPMCRRCEKVTPARAGYIRQRWREDLPTMEAWGNFYDYAAQSVFLTGRTQGRDGKPPFVADIEFLTKPASFAKIAEGKYHQ